MCEWSSGLWGETVENLGMERGLGGKEGGVVEIICKLSHISAALTTGAIPFSYLPTAQSNSGKSSNALRNCQRASVLEDGA